MSQPGSDPPLSTSSDAVAEGASGVREGTYFTAPLFSVDVLSVRTGRMEGSPIASSDTTDPERDIGDLLEKQEEVASFEINIGQKTIDVGLLTDTTGTRSRIERLFGSYVVTFFKGHLATSQRWTANMLKTDRGSYASAGVSIYYETPDVQSPREQEATQPIGNGGSTMKGERPSHEVLKTDRTQGSDATANVQASVELSPGSNPITIPSRPPRDAHLAASSSDPMDAQVDADLVYGFHVYVSTSAHIWQNNIPENGEVRCKGRVDLLTGIQIANCSFPGKQCCRNRIDKDTLLCKITNGDGPLRIPTFFDMGNGIDVCLIPLQYDVTVAKDMIRYRTVSPVVVENIPNKATPVFAVYGQYCRPGPVALHVLKATITRLGFGQRTTLGFYRRIIEYTLETPDVYTTQVGDCGSPLFTVVAGQVRLLGFHVAAFAGTATCYAVLAKSNLDVVPAPAGLERKIYIPATLKARLEERADYDARR